MKSLNRLLHFRPITIASMSFSNSIGVCVTGSIGMGKSTVTNQLRQLGFRVFDADKAVHELYSGGREGVVAIKKVCPEAVKNNCVDRATLSSRIMENPSLLREIEIAIHPLVHDAKRKFQQFAWEQQSLAVFYDIPLFFENRDKHPDIEHTIVVTASSETQRARVLTRGKGMNVEKFEKILSKQLPDKEKCALADFIINTDFTSYVEAKAQLAQHLEAMITSHGARWDAWKSHSKKSASTTTITATSTSDATSTTDDGGGSTTIGRSNSMQTNTETSMSSPPSSCALRLSFDAVIFDLDDTLVPVQKQLIPAHEAMVAYMTKHMPRTAAVVSTEIKVASETVKSRYPLVRHDLNEVRKRSLIILSEPFGEAHLVDGAMAVFRAERNNVSKNFYNDVVACFEWLSSRGVKIGILSNGSVDLQECELVQKHCSLILTAADVGCAKPSPVAFIACAQRMGVEPRRILYVGDSYEHDVLGAHTSGFKSAFLRRLSSEDEPHSHALQNVTVVPFADHSHTAVEWAKETAQHVYPDIELNTLFPEEFEAKLEEYRVRMDSTTK